MASQFQSASRSGGIAGVGEAIRLVERGSYLQASTACNQLLKQHPKVAAIWGVLSAAQVGMADHAGARRSALKGLKLDPESVDLRIRLGLSYAAEHRFGDAATEFERALRLAPGHAWATRSLADALLRQGRGDEAYELLRPHLAGERMDPGIGLAFVRVCLRTKRYDEALGPAGAMIDAGGMAPRLRTELLFVSGELYAKAGRYDRAFEVYRLANASVGAAFDARRNREGVDSVIGAWTPGALARLERPTRKADRFVFIVGMPRSGTSLVEQIIASHPLAFGCGELDYINNISAQISGSRDGWSYLDRLDRLAPGTLDQAAQQYIKELRRLAPGAERVTDKMPGNAMQLGLIAAMLPQARVIHCVRDARDTCLSCYFHDFLGRGNTFAYDLANLGAYYADYWRLMKHWKAALDIPILDVVYEELIADQGAQSRRLIDFVGLDWDGRCLEFHTTRRATKTLSADQVNRPIYTSSVARWRPYEKHLGPLLERLPADALRGEGGSV
jgi:tetratricopeptide (TPR) repeat protein